VIPPLTNNNAKTSAGEDFVKIRPAVGEHSHQKTKKQKTQETQKSKWCRLMMMISIEWNVKLCSVTHSQTKLHHTNS